MNSHLGKVVPALAWMRMMGADSVGYHEHTSLAGATTRSATPSSTTRPEARRRWPGAVPALPRSA